MAKTSVSPNSSLDHIRKVMYSEKEPPKNYIWGHPDGFFYVWEDEGWNGYDDLSQIKFKECPPDPEPDTIQPSDEPNTENLVTLDLLKETIAALRKELLVYILKTIKGGTSDIPSGSIITVIRQIESRLESLENGEFLTEQALQGYATTDWVNTQFNSLSYDDSEIQQSINDILSNYDGVIGRLSNIESNYDGVIGRISTVENDSITAIDYVPNNS